MWHATNGERGLNKRADYQQQMQALVATAADLGEERQRLERKIASFSGRSLDRDLLDEQARTMLGQVREDDIVVMLPAKAMPVSRQQTIE